MATLPPTQEIEKYLAARVEMPIPDLCSHAMSNVTPCVLALKFFGPRVVQDIGSCVLVLNTMQHCGEDWARRVLANSISESFSDSSETWLSSIHGLELLGVALPYSCDLCTKVCIVMFYTRHILQRADCEILLRMSRVVLIILNLQPSNPYLPFIAHGLWCLLEEKSLQLASEKLRLRAKIEEVRPCKKPQNAGCSTSKSIRRPL